MKKVAILGSTGSIGTQTLEIIRDNEDLQAVALAAGQNVDLMEKQIREFHPQIAGMWSEEAAADLRQRVSDLPVKIVCGMDGLLEIASFPESDVVVTAVVGMIGIRPTIAAIESGKTIALANKETLVTAGHIIMPLAAQRKVPILPVDSEHSAIFQSLQGRADNQIHRILLTASGGPFRGKKRADLEQMTLEDALKHPNWSMGRKITIDLKTPLTAIKGYVEGILDGIADTPEKQHKYLMTVANKVNDMDKLIDELTIYSKLDTNRVPYSFAKINLKNYFDDCCEEIGMDLETQDIDLEYRFHATSDCTVVADAEQLKRVVNNIVSNSVKYMQPGRKGKISIDIYDEGDYVHIIIADNGKGIGMDEIPHIFDRFYRTDSSRNSKQGGSGIGLAIVKKIIEDHKGKIWAESVEGEGTTMHINLLKDMDKRNYICIEDNRKKEKK